MPVMCVAAAVYLDPPFESGGEDTKRPVGPAWKAKVGALYALLPPKSAHIEEEVILDLRHSRNLGARRIQSELRRQNDLFLGLATIHKVLKRHQVKRVRKYRYKKDFICYERPIPGDRV